MTLLRKLMDAATKGRWTYGFPVVDGKECREFDCRISLNGFLIASVSHGPIFPVEPWGSAARERNAALIVYLRNHAEDFAELLERVDAVTWYDWSGNDSDAVADMEKLRAALAKLQEGE